MENLEALAAASEGEGAHEVGREGSVGDGAGVEGGGGVGQGLHFGQSSAGDFEIFDTYGGYTSSSNDDPDDANSVDGEDGEHDESNSMQSDSNHPSFSAMTCAAKSAAFASAKVRGPESMSIPHHSKAAGSQAHMFQLIWNLIVTYKITTVFCLVVLQQSLNEPECAINLLLPEFRDACPVATN